MNVTVAYRKREYSFDGEYNDLKDYNTTVVVDANGNFYELYDDETSFGNSESKTHRIAPIKAPTILPEEYDTTNNADVQCSLKHALKRRKNAC